MTDNDTRFVPASGTGTPAARELWVGTFPDGQQLMVECWLDQNGYTRTTTAAMRPQADRHIVWGPPITLERER